MDLAKAAHLKASNVRDGDELFAAENLLDNPKNISLMSRHLQKIRKIFRPQFRSLGNTR